MYSHIRLYAATMTHANCGARGGGGGGGVSIVVIYTTICLVPLYHITILHADSITF